MPSAADGSATRTACSRSVRRPAMIDALETRTASSATRRRSSRTAGMGRRSATPSGQGNQDGVEGRLGAGRWSPRPRRSRCRRCLRLAGCRRVARGPRPARAVSKSPSTSSSLASRTRMRSSLGAGAHRDATTVTSSPRPRPDQARAGPRLPALAHTTAREPWPASRLAMSSMPRALKLRTGFAVSSLMLTVHPGRAPAPRSGTAECRENRVDDPASRLDPGHVKARLLHGTVA